MKVEQAIHQVELQITELLKPLSFKKKGRTWYRDGEECVSLLNLQKSQWGQQFYVNLGVFVKRLDPSIMVPKEHQCHIRIRLTDLDSDKPVLEQCLDFDNEIEEEVRAQKIAQSVQRFAVKWFNSVETIERIRDALKEKDQVGSVSLRLKTLLSC